MIAAISRTLAGLAALVLACLIATAPAQSIPPDGAGPDTPGTSSTTSPTSGLRPGDTLNFRVSGFPGGETLYIKIDDGLNCSQAAVHGACVYHQQAIPASGTVSGSIVLPHDISPGQHWLRFLASEEMRDSGGSVIGTQGYTLRGQNFTVASGSQGSGGSSSNGGSGNGSSSGGGSSSSGGGGGSSSSGGGNTISTTPGGQGGGQLNGASGNTVNISPDMQQPDGGSAEAGQVQDGVLDQEQGEGALAGEALEVDWSSHENDDVDTDQDETDSGAAAQAAQEAREFLDQSQDTEDADALAAAPSAGTGGFPWIGVLVLTVLLGAGGLIVATMVQRRRAEA
ncbi:hypothetical protein [Nesterenkonia muleiensis]|uniref:hypothetical protein n=1 Tax=Nesterenkonia muleiensis TaxID=2282648 RepID=UPI000E71CBAE|nr:hypothetical protein [Nesterenkonia muleiensis]